MTLERLLRAAATAAACALLAAGLAGCGTSTSPSNVVPFSQLDVRLGTGTEAANGNTLSVNYTGWLYDASKTDAKGVQFETSVGGTPFVFTLGSGQVIKGWDQGIPGMKIGGVRRLVIPASLAYGSSRNGPIPPFASLVFEIELLDVQ